jgi:Dynein heavy chain AAA lid domain
LQEQILVVTLLNLLEAQLKPILGAEGKTSTMKPSDVDAAVQNIFLFSLVWSVGGSLTDTCRTEFDLQLRLYLDQKYAPQVLAPDIILLYASNSGIAEHSCNA